MAEGTLEHSSSSETQLEPDRVRLHVTPLNPTLVPSILPPSVLPLARNISFHSLQTFPEKQFGFVDLPIMEAQKLKKRLNGSTLKGTKVKIEDARPAKQVTKPDNTEEAESEVKKDKSEKPSKKRKRDPETISAVELQDRKVKRGWTDPKAPKRSEKKSKSSKDKDRVKSKYTSQPECLFKTSLPANVAASLKEKSTVVDLRKRRKGDLQKDVVVHEFSKTIRHASFLRSSGLPSSAKAVNEYVEGTGWVDQDGNVVEAPIRKRKGELKEDQEDSESSVDSDVSSVFEVLSDSEDESRPENVGMVLDKVAERLAVVDEDDTSSSGTSSSESETSSSGISSDDEDDEESSSDEEDDEVEDEKVENDKELNSKSALNKPPLENHVDTLGPSVPTPATPPNLKLNIPQTATEIEPATEVHPLEALFKRRRPDSDAPTIPEPVPSFNFFDAADADDSEGDEAENSIPMTPYTQRDLEFRGLRSAAPTPDTAHPGKTYTTWPTDNMPRKKVFDDDDEDGDVTPTQKLKARGKEGEKGEEEEGEGEVEGSDFQKWFYEHRGEANRAWKRRRKLVAKDKRHRENKRRSDRVM